MIKKEKTKKHILPAILIWAIAASYFFYDYTEQVIPNIIIVSVGRAYTLIDYRYALSSIVFALSIALLVACFLKETHAVSMY